MIRRVHVFGKRLNEGMDTFEFDNKNGKYVRWTEELQKAVDFYEQHKNNIG